MTTIKKTLVTFWEQSVCFFSCPKRLSVPALDISKRPAKLHVFRNYSVFSESSEVVKNDTMFRDAARASRLAIL